MRSDLRVSDAKANSIVPFNTELTDNVSRESALQHGSNGELNAADPSSSESRKAEPENSESAQIFLVLVALCTALAGTAVILYVISKRSSQNDGMKPAAKEFGQKVRPQVPVPLANETKPAEKSGADVQYEEEMEEENAVVELAQRYRRGQGEMQLLFSIQGHESEQAPLANLLQLSSSSKAKSKTKRLAKKIGLRKSEVDLLMRLQKCSTVQQIIL